MNRDALVRRMIVWEAAVKAIKAKLKTTGQEEHAENGGPSTHRMRYATVAGSETGDAVDVQNLDAFMSYLAGRYPTEVKTVTVQVVRNPDWLAQLKDALARISRYAYDEEDPEERGHVGLVIDADGTVIPGAVFIPGGSYITTSVTPNSNARRRAAAAARRGVEGDWTELERAIMDPGYLARDYASETPQEQT